MKNQYQESLASPYRSQELVNVLKVESNMITIDRKLKSLTQRELVVFDFDLTIVDCNSDTWINKLAPNEQLPSELEYKFGQDWIEYVQSVCTYLHGLGITQSDYIKCLSSMPSVPGVVDSLIETLAKQPDQYEMIILSDSNTFFINSYLKAKSLDGHFSSIITNPAKFDNDGRLLVSEYHIQEYCSLSSRNLCKGEALRNFIGNRMLDDNVVYGCINYVGDGENDLCPSAKLQSRDRVFAREGFSLNRLCNRIKSGETTGKLPELKATVIPWRIGDVILEKILN